MHFHMSEYLAEALPLSAGDDAADVRWIAAAALATAANATLTAVEWPRASGGQWPRKRRFASA